MRPNTGVTLPHAATTTDKVKALIDPLMLTSEQVSRIMSVLQAELWLGLSRDPERRKLTSLQMANTYVRELLNGSEEGDFLALDLGGTNFRVLLCKMRGGQCTSFSRNYNLPGATLRGPSAQVFDHLSNSIRSFMTEEGLLQRTNIPLGFTFSFPVEHNNIKEALLITWTKSFVCPDGAGADVVRMLEEALIRGQVTQVNVVAVLNDSTGTLLAGSYLDKGCRIGIAFGTGCNAAYVEKLENVDKWEGQLDGDAQVVIDTEWGAFGDNGCLDFIKTDFDTVVDQHSNWIGSFTFEKLFSGHYIGDLARLALLKLVQEGLVFTPRAADVLTLWGVFTAAHLSAVSKDTGVESIETLKVLQELGLSDGATERDAAAVRYVCSALTIRTSQLVSAAVATLLNHMAVPVCTVAIDGSVYRYHPTLHALMTERTAELAPSIKSKFILAEDGSGRGAAFLAAVTQRMRTRQGKGAGPD